MPDSSLATKGLQPPYPQPCGPDCCIWGVVRFIAHQAVYADMLASDHASDWATVKSA
jgi:fructuronate reductase